MTINSSGDSDGVRPGAQTLTLLGDAHIYLLLNALFDDGAMGQRDLRRAVGSPASSTLRGHLKVLNAAGITVNRKEEENESTSRQPVYDLTKSGRELLTVGAALQQWLAEGPEMLVLGGDPARSAIKGLVGGWTSTILGTLAPTPLSLVELDALIATVNYPTLERRLGALVFARQLESSSGSRGKVLYSLTDWIRQGVGPLIAAARWEHNHKEIGAAAIVPLDVECAFKLIAPMLAMPVDSPDGCCLFLKVRDDRRRRGETGAISWVNGMADYASGTVEREIDAWITGTTAAWFSAVIDNEPGELELDGDEDLSRSVLANLHSALFD